MHKTELTNIEAMIYVIRGQKVMLDTDLAELYGVLTKNLNKAVKRNQDRFPEDFMFQLTAEEHESLKSQIVTSKVGRGGRRYLPLAFTESGVAMLSSVLTSDRAAQVNVHYENFHKTSKLPRNRKFSTRKGQQARARH
jgi:hypothetical protein